MEDVAMAEKVVRRLKGFERSIRGLLDDNMVGPSTRELINNMRNGIDDLPLSTDEKVMDDWHEKVTVFEKRFSALQAAQTQQQQPPPPPPSHVVSAEPKEKLHLPKEKPVEHDGRVESFRPFLLRFNSLVGEVEVEGHQVSTFVQRRVPG